VELLGVFLRAIHVMVQKLILQHRVLIAIWGKI